MQDTKKKSIEQEERVAKIFNGKRTPQSGGGKWQKGDVLSTFFLVECKTTMEEKNSYSVSKKILEKADEQRREMGKDFYALAFTFGTDENYFVLNEKAMKFLISTVEEYLC